MTDEPHCVLDTNVLISALLSAEGTSNRAVHTILRYGVLLSSEEAFEELGSTLHREKFDPYLRPEDRDDYLSLIRGGARFVNVTEQIEACRDPDDDKFLECAVNGGADVIVTGDDDLLILHPFQGIPILSPNTFLESEFVPS
jgi:putative PIN family toxin of toxin-antitoxin system